MKTLAGFCLALLLAAGMAQAQVSSPDLLASPFDDTPIPSGMAPTLLQSRPDILPAPGILWEGRNELTVHTNKGSQGLLDDVHANGTFVALRAALNRSPSAPRLVLSERTLETGIADNEGGKAFHLRGNFRQPEGRLLWPLGRHVLAYAGYQDTTYNADGTTSLYSGIFTVFPNTPPFRYEGRERLALAGVRLPLASAWTVEAIAGHTAEPSRLLLHQDGVPTQIILPLGDSGITALLAVRRRLTTQFSLLAYVGGEHLRGTGNVAREAGLTIGTATTTHSEDSGGVCWQCSFGEHRTLGVFGETSRDRWQTEGNIPDLRAIETGYKFASDLRYGASYVIRKDDLGVRWSRIASGRQEFSGTAQLIQFSMTGEANYAARDFGLLKTGQTTYRQDNLRVLLLRGSYAVPWKKLRFGLEASQLVPLGGGSGGGGGSSSGGGTASSDRRVTSGGWSLNARLERLF